MTKKKQAPKKEAKKESKKVEEPKIEGIFMSKNGCTIDYMGVKEEFEGGRMVSFVQASKRIKEILVERG